MIVEITNVDMISYALRHSFSARTCSTLETMGLLELNIAASCKYVCVFEENIVVVVNMKHWAYIRSPMLLHAIQRFLAWRITSWYNRSRLLISQSYDELRASMSMISFVLSRWASTYKSFAIRSVAMYGIKCGNGQCILVSIGDNVLSGQLLRRIASRIKFRRILPMCYVSLIYITRSNRERVPCPNFQAYSRELIS